jgi:hypothetical protein
LSGLAADITDRIRKGEAAADLLPRVEQLEKDMRELRGHLAPLLPPSAQSVAPQERVDRDLAITLMRRIASLLREYDGEAIDLLAESNMLLISMLGEAAHKRIEEAARRFDFDATLRALLQGAHEARIEL